MTSDKKLLLKQALTDEPYKKMLRIEDDFPKIAPAPIIKMPVPKKKDEAIETPKYFLKITFKKVYKLAQPRLITTFPSIAQISEPKLTLKERPTKSPANTAPKR